MKNSFKLGLATLAISAAALTGCQSGGRTCVSYEGYGQRVCPTYNSPCTPQCYQAPCADSCAPSYLEGQQLTPAPARAAQ